MKRLLTVVCVTLAVNFLLAVGGVAYLFKTGRLDEEKVRQIREMVGQVGPATQPATQPAEGLAGRDPTTQPTLALDAMMAKVSGRPVGEQVELLQRTFEAQQAVLDQKRAELAQQVRTIERAQEEVRKARETLAADRAKFAAAQAAQAKLAADQGFQDTLNLYTTMPARQVKAIFMSLEDETVLQYLRAMEPRDAAKITKEFKTPEEAAKVGRILERMRLAAAATQPTGGTASAKE